MRVMPVLLLLAAGPLLAAPESVQVGGLKLTVECPAGWQVRCRDPLILAGGASGRAQFQVHPLPAKIDAAEMQKKHLDFARRGQAGGELARADARTAGGVAGVLTVESPRDSGERRLRWIACDPGGYFHLTFSAPSASFDALTPVFMGMLDSTAITRSAPASPR